MENHELCAHEFVKLGEKGQFLERCDLSELTHSDTNFLKQKAPDPDRLTGELWKKLYEFCTISPTGRRQTGQPLSTSRWPGQVLQSRTRCLGEKMHDRRAEGFLPFWN